MRFIVYSSYLPLSLPFSPSFFPPPPPSPPFLLPSSLFLLSLGHPREDLVYGSAAGLCQDQAGGQWPHSGSRHRDSGQECGMSWVRIPLRQLIFPLEKWLPWVYCVALPLPCYLYNLACFLLASFCLPSASLINMHTCTLCTYRWLGSCLLQGSQWERLSRRLCWLQRAPRSTTSATTSFVTKTTTSLARARPMRCPVSWHSFPLVYTHTVWPICVAFHKKAHLNTCIYILYIHVYNCMYGCQKYM